MKKFLSLLFATITLICATIFASCAMQTATHENIMSVCFQEDLLSTTTIYNQVYVKKISARVYYEKKASYGMRKEYVQNLNAILPDHELVNDDGTISNESNILKTDLELKIEHFSDEQIKAYKIIAKDGKAFSQNYNTYLYAEATYEYSFAPKMQLEELEKTYILTYYQGELSNDKNSFTWVKSKIQIPHDSLLYIRYYNEKVEKEEI